MTKKDYELLAKILSYYEDIIHKDKLVEELCRELKADNSRFIASKFASACYEGQ